MTGPEPATRGYRKVSRPVHWTYRLVLMMAAEESFANGPAITSEYPQALKQESIILRFWHAAVLLYPNSRRSESSSLLSAC